MMCKKNRRCLSIAAALLALSAQVHAAFQRSGAPNVTFTAAGPAGLSIVGKGSELNIQQSGDVLAIHVPLAGFDTGISLRNKHMREKYLEVQKYPEAELSVSRAAIKLPNDAGQVRAEATGTLRIHGTAKPQRFNYQIARSGSGYHVVGDMHINMRDFDIVVPSYLGVTVKPEIDVKVEFDAFEHTAAP